MQFTVKEKGFLVANPSLRARFNADEIRSWHDSLLYECGFIETQRLPNMIIYCHTQTLKMIDSERLMVVWREDPYVLSIQRGDFVKSHKIGGEYDLYDFVSEIIQSLRDVWVEGSP